MRPLLGYCNVDSMKEVLGRDRRAKPKIWGWGVVYNKHENGKTAIDILDPSKDTATTYKTRAAHILSLNYSLFISINNTSFI